MTYTIKDEKGNMICSIENVNPIRSNERFQEYDLNRKEQEQVSHNEKCKKIKDIIDKIIKNKDTILNKINQIKMPESSLLDGSRRNKTVKKEKYKMNDHIFSRTFIDEKKDIKYKFDKSISISSGNIFFGFGNKDEDDKEFYGNYTKKITKDNYKEAISIANGEFFENYENKVLSVLKDTINSLIGLNADPNISIRVANYSGFEVPINNKYYKRAFVDKDYFEKERLWNEYTFRFYIEIKYIITQEELNSTKIASEKGCDEVLEYLWDFNNVVATISKNIKNKLPFNVNYLKTNKDEFISMYRPSVDKYLKKHSANYINAKELLKFILEDNKYDDYKLGIITMYYNNDDYDIPKKEWNNLNNYMRQYSKNFEINIKNDYRSEVCITICPKNNIKL